MFQSPVILKCSHPRRIKNPATGEYMYVPCGHCANCRASYRSKWLQRINLECDASVSVLFFTLTYDNDHVPLFTIDDEGNCISNRSERDNFNLLYDYYDLNDIPYVHISKTHQSHNSFAYCCKSDVQKFLKRLRRFVDYDSLHLLNGVSQVDRQIRYFICSEYGPETFRPHYHGLLFLRSKQLAKAIIEHYFDKAWQLCSTANRDISEVFATASKYVAKYVACESRIPAILQNSFTHTFHLFSRSPTIGCTYLDVSTLSNKLYSHTLTYHKAVTTQRDGIVDVEFPLPSQSYRYYLPKPYKFDSYTRNDLIAFYNRAYQLCPRGITDLNAISNSLPNLCKYVKNRYNIGIDITICGVTSHATYSSVYSLLTTEQKCYGIYHNRMCLCRAMYVINNLHLTPSSYVDMLLSCNSVTSSTALKFQYQFENFVRCHEKNPLNVFLYINPSFVDALPYQMLTFDIFEEAHFNNMLKSWQLSLDDFYDDGGILKRKFRYHEHFDLYCKTSMFQDFSNYVNDENINFDKTRTKNHLCNPYDAF